MKVNVLGAVATPVDGVNSVRMSIDDAGIDFLMHNLTNLYSKPHVAVLREYSSNAVDSHTKAGQSRPVEITLPHYSNQYTLTIRDFGVGMSREELTTVYSRYGSSTKRDSNTQIGAFGLGAKSALAITDRFDVESVKDGVKTVLYVAKNEKGVGVLHFVSEEPTTDVNGFTVKISYASGAHQINEEVARAMFLSYPSETILLNGAKVASVYDENWTMLTVDGEAPTAWVDFSENVRRGWSREVHASVGGVLYTVQSNTEEFNKLGTYGRNIVLSLPIGSVDLTPSREELMYTDKTRQTLQAVSKDVLTLLPTYIQSSLDAAESIEEAARSVIRELGMGMWHREFTYKNQQIDHNINFSLTNWKHVGKSNGRGKPFVQSVNVDMQLSNWFRMGLNVVLVDDLAVAEIIAKNASDYFASKTNNAYGAFFITDLKAEQITNPFVKGAIVAETYESILATAKEYRSEKRKAAALERKNNGYVKSSASFVVLTLSSPENKAYKTPADSLAKESNIIYLQQGASSKLSNLVPSLNGLYDNSYAHVYENGGNLALLRSAFPSHKLVFLTHNRSLDKFKTDFPQAVDATVALREYATNALNNLDEDAVSVFVADKVRRTYAGVFQNLNNIADGLEQYGAMGQIISQESVKNLNTISKLRKPVDKTVVSLLNWGSPSEVQNKLVGDATQQLLNFAAKYQLLPNYVTESNLAHVVGYINMVDKM